MPRSKKPATGKRKQTAKRGARRSMRGVALKKHLGVPAGMKAEFSASLQGCLDKTVAEKLVFSCTGVGAVDTGTTLGELFPSDERRSGFCGCVFNKAAAAGATVSPGSIPCSASNTVEDVIDSISC